MTTKSHTKRTSHRKTSHNGHAKKALRHDAENLRSDAENLLYHTLDEFKDKTEGVRTVVGEYVKEKPLKSLGAAVLAGAVLALLLKR